MEEVTGYWLTRFVFQRGLAAIYLIAFLVALNQFTALAGEKGLLPVGTFLKRVPFWNAPSLFYVLPPKDTIFTIAAWIGVFLSILALTGISERFGTPFSMTIWALLWLLYLSFVNVGQTFYGFGWESILLEAGFFAIFMGGTTSEASSILLWLERWVLFRVMFGAGLIKLRGDPCWQNLTCLFYHYETQPLPNPLSWYIHWLPLWMHKVGVLFNHFAELIIPFFYFAPQPFAAIAGLITIIFQGTLIVSGNLSWLNWLTIVLAISTFHDKYLGIFSYLSPFTIHLLPPWHIGLIWIVTIITAILSVRPIVNMLSPRQLMNASFNPLHLVNTYGAFGSVTKERYEIVLEGTDELTVTPSTHWREYEFKGKPGNVSRMPSQIAPYHLRLDWLMWFLPFHVALTPNGITLPYGYEPWFLRFVEKLLQGDSKTLKLLASNPFPQAPPHYIRALYYRYQFTTSKEKSTTGNWWKRELIGTYLPPASLKASL